MRRTRLIWFALGAGTSLLATVISMMFLSSDEPSPMTPFLELIEPLEMRASGEEVRDEDMIANITGELARSCGAKFFETTFLYNDHSPTTEIAITPDNAKVIQCVRSAAAERAIETNIIFRKANNAQTH